MKANHLPDYPRIALADLSALEIDSGAARRFERRFRAGFLGGVALAFGGYALSALLHHFRVIGDEVFATVFLGSFIFGGTMALWTHRRMMRARPRSTRSGREMTPFIIQDVEAQDGYEVAYVDQPSGTYFRRRYVERG